MTFLASLGLVLTFASPGRADTLYVDDGAAAGGDGSRESPFRSVQAAIDAAASGDEIRVAAGTYAAIDVDTKELVLRGGFDATFAAPGTAPSVLEGTRAAPVVRLYETGDSVLEGFTIGGGAQGIVVDADYLSTTNHPTIRDNVIEDNGSPAVPRGGGVFADHCEIVFSGNVVRDNAADRGAGVAMFCTSTLLEENLVENNVAAGDHGGGIYLAGPAITLRGNVVRGNRIGEVLDYGWGGGALVYGVGTSARFERNVFTENYAVGSGSGVFVDDGASAVFDHDLFYSNVCGRAGGNAVFVDGAEPGVPSHAELVHVTIANHDCPETIGNAVAVELESTVTIENSIVWGNGGDDFRGDETTARITARYTLSEEAIEGEGNLTGDPLFADPASGDFHVRSTEGRFDPAARRFVMDADDSPTIDAGDPSADFALEPGPNGLRANLGHTGNTTEASMGGPGGTPPDAGPLSPDGGAGTSDGGVGPGSDGSVSMPPTTGDDGCGCRTGGGPLDGAISLLCLAALALRRRR